MYLENTPIYTLRYNMGWLDIFVFLNRHKIAKNTIV